MPAASRKEKTLSVLALAAEEFAAALYRFEQALVRFGGGTLRSMRGNACGFPAGSQRTLSDHFVRSTRTLQPHGSTYISQLPSSIGLIFTFG
ncbi:unnamed protein product [marine sediment metagenome]|uniref:Uncharacterized protein n=1 Tax=marine sediment metagenome TaxID=412755 RepID=X1GBR9_9ZZZZ